MTDRFPPAPAPILSVPRGYSGLEGTFGKFAWEPTKVPFVKILGSWSSDNLVHLDDVCGTGLHITLHRLVAPLFVEALGAAMAAAPAYKVRDLQGWCARQKVTLDPEKQAKAPLSVHSWGAAFDINPAQNPLSATLKTDIPEPFIRAFTLRGWTWGGEFSHPKDAMHFQYAVGV